MKRVMHAAFAALALGLVAFVSAPGGAQPPVSPPTISNGVVQYPWVDGVPVRIYCTPGMTCDLGFERGEDIQDIVCAKSAKVVGPQGWIIDQGAQGSRPFIYITGAVSSPTANMIVTTSKRRYVALLLAQPSSHLSYEIVARTPMPAVVASPSPQPSPTPRLSDTNFRVDGSAPFAITQARRDADLTFFTLGEGLYGQPDVAAFNVSDGFKPGGCPARDHQEARMTPVGYVTDPHNPRMLIVQGIFPALVIYSGDGPKQQCQYLIRAGGA